MKKQLLIAGYIIYIIGIIAGACFAAPKPPIWPPFIVSLIVIVIGAIMINKAYKPAPQKDASEVKENRGAIQEMLERIYNTSKDLRDQLNNDKTDPNDVKDAVDKLVTGDVLNFAEKRQYLINVLGLEPFVEIFGAFANGERNLNRTWSTLADGAPEEGKIALDKATNYFEEACASIKVITKKKGTGNLI